MRTSGDASCACQELVLAFGPVVGERLAGPFAGDQDAAPGVAEVLAAARFPLWDPHPHPLDLLASWLVRALDPMDARRIAQREAGWQGWALEERLAARDPARWYGPDSPEARTDPAELAAEAEALIARARPQFEASQREVLAEASPRAVPPPSAPAPEPSSPEPDTRPEPEPEAAL